MNEHINEHINQTRGTLSLAQQRVTITIVVMHLVPNLVPESTAFSLAWPGWFGTSDPSSPYHRPRGISIGGGFPNVHQTTHECTSITF